MLEIYIHSINANMIIEQIHTLKYNINEKKKIKTLAVLFTNIHVSVCAK